MLRDETIQRVIRFRDDRDWKQFHTPKDLAISMSLEAAELLELFQWSGADLDCTANRGKLKEELADILEVVYALASLHSCTKEELLAVYDEKHEKRGGFEKRLLLIESERGN
jgi:NTP pyrophosphatase (non-canonical NTP hydrolase)